MRDSDGAKKTNETMGRSGKRMHDVLKLMKTANNKEERRQAKKARTRAIQGEGKGKGDTNVKG